MFVTRLLSYDSRVPYLIEVRSARLSAGLSFGQVIGELDAAYRHVERAFRDAPASRYNASSQLSTAALRGALPRVPLAAQPEGDLAVYAGHGHWELSEVHRQLCQVAVLLEALRLVSARHPHGRVTGISPTQQPGADAAGSDGTGGIWALEVFGGLNVRNNDKARNDARSLLRWTGLSHRYFACFQSAWDSYGPTTCRFSLECSSEGDEPVDVRLVHPLDGA